MSGAGAQGSRRRPLDSWLLLGMLGALLGASLLFVHVPATLWAGNTAEFHWRFGTYLRHGLPALAAVLALVLVVLWLLPRFARRPASSLLAATSLAAWVYAFFLAGRMTVLDGAGAPMDFRTPLGAWELPLLGALCLVAATAIARGPRTAVFGLLALNLGLVVATAGTIASVRTHRVRAPLQPERSASVFRFSPRENVLVLLLDGLQSGVVEDIFRRDPELRSAFDGFRFYRDALGVAPTTFISLPAIHSGIEYEPQGSLHVYFEESIRLRSFMSRFADAGYEAALVNPMEGLCPDGIAVCTTSAQLLRSSGAQLRSESLRLLDLSLFRLAPVWVKARIYDDGNWFFAGRFDRSEEISRIFEHNRLLDEMGRRLTVREGPPTLKVVHSLATHTPFVLNADCRTLGPSSVEQLAPQARCALLAVARLLDALEAAGIYDQTELLLVADHGIGIENAAVPTASAHDREWARRAGYANPAFLLKRRADRGELRDDASEVHLPDVAATLCASSGACTAPDGVPAGEAATGRPRRFLQHEWRHEYWRLRDVPRITAYEVRGPLWDAASWRMVGELTGDAGAATQATPGRAP